MFEKEIFELKDKLKEIEESIKDLLRETAPTIDNDDQIQTLRNQLEYYKERLNTKVYIFTSLYISKHWKLFTEEVQQNFFFLNI